MNTNDISQHEDDERRPAVRHAENGAQAWRAVVHDQRSAVAEHADFYALAGDLLDTLRALEALALVLAGQVGAYGQGRAVYDDTGADPQTGLARAAQELTRLAAHIGVAEYTVNRFWSAIGHIGIADATTPDDPTPDGLTAGEVS